MEPPPATHPGKIPMGPPFVWLPASLLLLNRGDMGAGIFMFLWGLIVVTGVESILRPYFISREGKLPFLLVFLGSANKIQSMNSGLWSLLNAGRQTMTTGSPVDR